MPESRGHPFDDIEEALLCFDRALAQRHNSGDDDGDNHGMSLLKCAQVYPSTMQMKPVVPFKGFTMNGGNAHQGGSYSSVTFDFNFQLGIEWRSTKSDFSFSDTFSKIHAKLSQKSGVCWWFSILNGKMLAFKGKAKKGHDAEPYAATEKEKTLHAMMAEMENKVR